MTRTGEYIFWNFIIPIVQTVAKLIACKNLFLFAIDTPKLIKYYKTVLGFKEIQNIDEKILKMFSNLMKPYFNKIKNCQLSIVNLQSARDKLLPKLMNGEIEV